MNKIKYIMNYYKSEHLTKYYIIGGVISFLCIYGGARFKLAFFLGSTLLYPFAMGAYAELKYNIFKNVSFNIIDIFVGIILFLFSMPVGGIKVLLIYFGMNNNDKYVRSNAQYQSEDKSDDITW